MKNIITVSNMIYFVLVPLFYLWSIYWFITLPNIKGTNEAKKKTHKFFKIVSMIMISMMVFILYCDKFHKVPLFEAIIKTKIFNFPLTAWAMFLICLPLLALLTFFTAKSLIGMTPEDFRVGIPEEVKPQRLKIMKMLGIVFAIVMSLFIIVMYLVEFASYTLV